MKRIVEPEILDSLPSDDPAAVESRRDLRLINWFMGNTRWLKRTLEKELRSEDRLVELGAGGGELGRALQWRGNFTALDFAPRPANWPEPFQWVSGDFFVEGERALKSATVVTAGLVLHHFENDGLRKLGAFVSEARLLVVCEPARRKRHILQGFLLRLLGINWVTRHDLPVSVRAGFLKGELPNFLGLDTRKWTWKEEMTIFGAYRLVARRAK